MEANTEETFPLEKTSMDILHPWAPSTRIRVQYCISRVRAFEIGTFLYGLEEG